MSELGIGIKVAKMDFEIFKNLMTLKTENKTLSQIWTKDGNREGL
jgi:hypothetical protein